MTPEEQHLSLAFGFHTQVYTCTKCTHTYNIHMKRNTRKGKRSMCFIFTWGVHHLSGSGLNRVCTFQGGLEILGRRNRDIKDKDRNAEQSPEGNSVYTLYTPLQKRRGTQKISFPRYKEQTEQSPPQYLKHPEISILLFAQDRQQAHPRPSILQAVTSWLKYLIVILKEQKQA